jgi:phage terminase large subunit
LAELFEFKLQPLEIHCINGNSFLARGCDDTTKLKSIKDPTSCWFEEDIPTENDFITITTSIRTTKADYLQEIFTINPEVEGNYQDNWFWKRFFKGKDGLSYSDITTIEIDKDTKVDLTYTVHHSTYKDNKWIPNEFIAFLMDLKRTNPYYWEVYCNGKWGNRILGGLFYKNFNVARNTFTYPYNPNIPIHLSFDFNVKPYMSCSVWQIVGKACYLIDEIAMKSPQNSTKWVCNEFKSKYFAHQGGLFIYGDPSGHNEDTRSEAGHNDYKLIMSELSMLKPTKRVASLHPPVAMRGNFINEIFANNYADISINLFENSVYLKNDLLFGKEASDGTKLKEKVKGEDGSTYEKYHHFSDTMDYLICEAFKEYYEAMRQC